MENQPPIKYYSLSELAESLQTVLRKSYASGYWIKAEIAKLNLYPKSGHCYPDLVEKSSGKILAQMRGIIWAGDFQRINANMISKTGEPLAEGMEILFFCKPEFSPNHGLSLLISEVNPEFSLGKMLLEKQKTIESLKAENLYYQNKSLIFPRIPKRIAVISVKTSKGFQDFKNVIDSYNSKYSVHYQLFTALLQGDKAVDSIVSQLNLIKENFNSFDVVTIIRGGGGEVGLSCYDSYDLATQIARFPIPILSGIGHSTNETVAEMVSFQSFITPTELAYFILSRFEKENNLLSEFSVRLGNSSKNFLRNHRSSCTAFAHEINNLVRNAAKSEVLNLANNQNRLLFSIKSKLHFERSEQFAKMQKIQGLLFQTVEKNSKLSEHYQYAILEMTKRNINNQKSKLVSIESKIETLNPSYWFERGYSLLFKDTTLVRSIKQVGENDELRIRLGDGELNVKIISKTKLNN